MTSNASYREAPVRPTCSACGRALESPPVYTPAGEIVCDGCELRRVAAEADRTIDREGPLPQIPAPFGPSPPQYPGGVQLPRDLFETQGKKLFWKVFMGGSIVLTVVAFGFFIFALVVIVSIFQSCH